MAQGASDGVLVHGTCVAYSGLGILLRGAPGSGKSDLALRFLAAFGGAVAEQSGAVLVADDQVLLERGGDNVIARAPASIANKLEVRGVGIVEFSAAPHAILSLIVDLKGPKDIPRLPPDPLARETVLGVRVAVIALDPWEASAPVKLMLALTGRLA